MNEDCRWLGTPVVRIRILAGLLILLAAGCLVLGRSSRSGQVAATVADQVPAFRLAQPEIVPANSVSPIEAKARLQSHARSLFAGLPLMFEPNLGQGNPAEGALDVNDPRVKFIARGSNYSLFLGSQGAILNLSAIKSARKSAKKVNVVESLQMKLAGANANARVTAAEALPGKSNYLLGNDPAKWKIGVPQFARVRYENIYPGINLVFYGNQGHLEYDFQVAPGADPNQAELQFDGAQRVLLNGGALLIAGPSGAVRFEVPHVYQEVAGREQTVDGKFVLRGHRVGFAIGNYDHSRELVIDPVLTFSTYFGGAGNELNNYVAIDQSFNIYLTGSTDSTNLPIPAGETCQYTGCGALTATPPSTNVYIAKITPPLGSAPAVLDFVTYLGGTGPDYPVGIGVDGAGNPYVAGTTSSANFPVSTNNPYQGAPASPGTHVFVTRLTSDASTLTYSSYLSGSGTDIASGMTTDGQGFIYVTGVTTSTNPSDYAPGVQWPAISLPNGQPFQPTPKDGNGGPQFFVTKVSTQSFGSASITYSTYFGGGVTEAAPSNTGGGITVDQNGNIYFSGTTNFVYTGTDSLTDFPILNAYQPCLDQPAPAVVVNPPTCSPTSSNSATDAFVAKLNPNAPAGTGQLGWSTYIGGSDTDSSTGVAVDPNGAANVYVVGTTNSPDIATSQLTSTTTSAFQRCLDQPMNPTVGQACTPPTPPAPTDAFVAKFPNLVASTTTFSNLQLTYFSFLGGSGNENGLAIAVDTASGALLTGNTQSNDFPVFGAANIQSSLQGTQDAFIARLNTAATTQSSSGIGSWTSYFGGSTTSSGGSAFTEGTSVAVDANQNVYFAGDTTSVDLTVEKPVQMNNAGGSDAFVTELGNASTVTISGLLTIANNQSYVSAGNQATFTYTITNGGPDPAYNISVIDSLVQTATVSVSFNNAQASTGICSSGSSTTVNVICTIPSLQAGSTATVTIVVIPTLTASGGGGSHQFTGGTVQVLSASNILLAQTSVTANLSDYTMAISPSNQSVVAGNTASYQVTLTPVPLYSSQISLTCSGVPAAAACNFTNSQVTLPGASPGSSTLNLTTTVRPINTTSNSFLRHFYALWLIVPGISLIGMRSSDRRRRRIAGLLMLLTVFSLLVLLPACAHGVVQPPVSGTPAGTYTIIVTATSGTDAKSSQVDLVVF